MKLSSLVIGCLVALILTGVTDKCITAETALPIPPGPEIVSKISKTHPRLLATKEDFARVKREIGANKTIESLYADLKAQGQKLLKDPPSKYEIPDGLRLLSTSRRVLNRTLTLAMLYRVENDPQYLDRAWKELQAAAEFKDWNPRHFLDTAEMAHAFAIGYDWLYDAWTPQQRETLRQAMVEKGFKPALEIYRKNTGWARARHNWNQVCNGGIGIGALALADELPEMAAEILNAALKSIQLPMAEFNPDGAWSEGPGYWNYATMYNVAFLAAVQTALGTDYGLSKMPGFSEAGMFPIYMSGPLGRTFNYADAGDGRIRAPHMFWMAKAFKQPLYAWYQRQHASGNALDLIWYDNRGEAPTPAAYPLDKYFRDAEVASFRSAWNDREALFLGFKGGDNKANHSNLDLGSFVLDAKGYRWAIDLGADDYNMPGYFGKQRWTYYRMRAESHNTLLINPGKDADQLPTAAAKIVKYSTRPEQAAAVVNLSSTYGTNATQVLRGFAMLDRRQVMIQDEIKLPKPSEVWWFMHTPAKIAVAADGRSAVLRQGEAVLFAQVTSPAAARFVSMDAKPLPSSPNPEVQKKNAGIQKLALNLNHISGDVTLCVILTPLGTGEKATHSKAPLKPLAEW